MLVALFRLTYRNSICPSRAVTRLLLPERPHTLRLIRGSSRSMSSTPQVWFQTTPATSLYKALFQRVCVSVCVCACLSVSMSVSMFLRVRVYVSVLTVAL